MHSHSHKPVRLDVNECLVLIFTHFRYFTASRYTWGIRYTQKQCDYAGGEKYVAASSGLAANEAACKKSCEDTTTCVSITYFASKWCSHFSTGCTKRKAANGVAIQLRRDSRDSFTT